MKTVLFCVFALIIYIALVVSLFHKSDGDARYKEGFMDGIQARIEYEHGK